MACFWPVTFLPGLPPVPLPDRNVPLPNSRITEATLRCFPTFVLARDLGIFHARMRWNGATHGRHLMFHRRAWFHSASHAAFCGVAALTINRVANLRPRARLLKRCAILCHVRLLNRAARAARICRKD